MKSYYKMIKRWDVMIVLSLILLSFLPMMVFSYIQAEKVTENSTNVAVISVNGKEVRRITLTNNTNHEIFDVYSEDGDVNTIEVKENQIRIKAADCSDQVCVLTGFISKPGETIVCLPHKVLVEIQTEDGSSGDDEELIIST